MRLVIFGFGANPPGKHHLDIVLKLMETFNRVVIIPRGTDSNKPSLAETNALQRKEMVNLTFDDLAQIEIDFFDLERDIFTPTWQIDLKYKRLFPGYEIWHAVGYDIIKGGAESNSQIQTSWRKGQEIWKELNWAVINHPGLPINPTDLPPKNIVITMHKLIGRSTLIRNRIIAGQPITGLVSPKVERYILKNNLYK